MTQKIAAVVVTYNIGKKYIKNFTATLPEVDKVFIVDNGSESETLEVLKKLELENSGKVFLIANLTNIGLAKAQNEGIKKALEENFDWVLLLDHDSTPEPGMVKKMLEVHENYKNKEMVGMLLPSLLQEASGQKPLFICKYFDVLFLRKTFDGRQYLDDVAGGIASGSLIKSRIFNLYGLMKEEFFIDYIDVEFCLRIVGKGYKIIAVRDAVLRHEIGAKQVHKFLFFKIVTSNHSAERRYTIFKNRCYVWRKYIFKVPSYVLYDALAAFYDVFRIIFFEKNKKDKLKNIYFGIRDSGKLK